jgi:hypothetical protein
MVSSIGVLEQTAEEFCADDDAVAARVRFRKEIANDLLRMAVGIDIGRVDEVAAAISICGNHILGFCGACSPAMVLAERHGSKTERADA